MFCDACGNSLSNQARFCPKCGAPAPADSGPGAQAENATWGGRPADAQSYQAPPVLMPPAKAKSKIAAALLGIFLGSLGIHNYYLGFTKKATIQLLITLLSCFFLSPITSLWGLIEGILILVGNIDRDADGNTLF